MPVKKPVLPPTSTKRLQIQIGIVKRTVKEVKYYEDEVIMNEARIQKMRDDGKDSYDIKKQEEVLQESYMMVPDSKNRMEKTFDTLSELIDELCEEADMDPLVLEEARTLLASQTPVVA